MKQSTKNSKTIEDLTYALKFLCTELEQTKEKMLQYKSWWEKRRDQAEILDSINKRLREEIANLKIHSPNIGTSLPTDLEEILKDKMIEDRIKGMTIDQLDKKYVMFSRSKIGRICKAIKNRWFFEDKMPTCPNCGTEVLVDSARKAWKMAGRPDRTGKKTELTIGVFDCPKCKKSFRFCIGKKKI